jgi:hypothetical protein
MGIMCNLVVVVFMVTLERTQSVRMIRTRLFGLLITLGPEDGGNMYSLFL